MQNGIRPATIRRDNPQPSSPSATSQATAVIPMPGRLEVHPIDAEYLAEWYTTLDQVPAGETVTTVGTITHVRYLDTARVRNAVRTGDRTGLGRAMAVITDSRGNTAHLYLHADAAADALDALHTETKVFVSGVVFRTVASQPAGINARTVRVVES